ncbi:MAG: signal peptidase [Actinomycetota bacterium]
MFFGNGRSVLRSFRFWQLIALGVVLALLARLFVFGMYQVASESMSPTLRTGDRVVVWKWAKLTGVDRGDIVVFDGTGSFVAADSTTTFADTLSELIGIKSLDSHLFVKRVIGVGGDIVKCCDSEGFISVNGQRLVESYLPSSISPSNVEFEVQVPPGRMFVMGDNRPESQDSRSLLGSPGGGMIDVDKVVGRVARAL